MTLAEGIELAVAAMRRAAERLDGDEPVARIAEDMRLDLDASELPGEVRDAMRDYHEALADRDPASGPFNRHVMRSALETLLEKLARARGE
jgi:hypothetical protein